MVTIAWDDRYRIGLPIIDNQHKYLLQLINQLYDNVSSGAMPHTLDEVFNNLDDYAIYHFSIEERWMQGQLYPELSSHQQEHATFKEHVVELRERHLRRDSYASLKTLSFLYHWLTTHIQGSDFQFGQFIARNTGNSLHNTPALLEAECADQEAVPTTLSHSINCSTSNT